MKKLITICLVIAAVTGTSFGSVGEGYAIEMFDIVIPQHWILFWLKNDISSTSVVSSLTVDGSTAVDGPVVWKGVHITQPPLWPENLEWDPESLVTFSATEEGFTGIEPGDAIYFKLLIRSDMDILDLIGVEVQFNFEDGSTWRGVFVDDPTPEQIVLVTLSVDQKVDDILDFFDESVADGTLTGTGKNEKQALNQLKKFCKLFEKACDLIKDGKTNKAMKELEKVYERVDGKPTPSDIVEGEAADQLARQILALMDMLASE